MGVEFDFRYWTKAYEKDYDIDVKGKYPSYVECNGVEHKEKSPYFGEMSEVVQKRGYLLLKEFISVGRWKAARQIPNYEENSEEAVQETTRRAMKVRSEEEQVSLLIDGSLKGVKIPVASAILTVLYPNKYCVIDYRAWRALGWLDILSSKGEFILESYGKYSEYLDSLNNYRNRSVYLKFLRKLRKMAKKRKMTARQLDMALWKFDKMKGERLAKHI